MTATQSTILQCTGKRQHVVEVQPWGIVPKLCPVSACRAELVKHDGRKTRQEQGSVAKGLASVLVCYAGLFGMGVLVAAWLVR